MRNALRHLYGLCAAIVLALALVHGAHAAGGNYVFDGGSRSEQDQVRHALDASSFDWSLVPVQVVVHIAADVETEASPGQIWLASSLLDSGEFSWGVVQHEYAHQVDFFLLDAAARQELLQQLGGSDWCYEVPNLPHGAHGCERFASTLAWAYWQSPENCMRPQSPTDESAAMAPSAFRALLKSLIDSAVGDRGGAAGVVAHAPAPARPATPVVGRHRRS
jgi:hypothetical protein